MKAFRFSLFGDCYISFFIAIGGTHFFILSIFFRLINQVKTILKSLKKRRWIARRRIRIGIGKTNFKEKNAYEHKIDLYFSPQAACCMQMIPVVAYYVQKAWFLVISIRIECLVECCRFTLLNVPQLFANGFGK